jgi:hypothetical protein
LNVSALCTAAFLTALFPSFGAEMANSIDRAPAPTSGEHQLFAQSGLGSDKQSAIGASAGAAFLDGNSALGNPYLVQARSDSVVICSFVGKVVMCHRIVRSYPPRLLLPRRLPREQQRNKLPTGPYRF